MRSWVSSWSGPAVAAARRVLLFALVWAGLSEADPDYLVYGVVSVALATALSLVLLPPPRRPPRRSAQRAARAVLLAVWFLGLSVRGGHDVAMRTLAPRLRVEPAVLTAPLRLPEGAGRHLALSMMNVMPGTMVQRVVVGDEGHEEVELHTLDPRLGPVRQWEDLQARIARVTGAELEDDGIR